jgi:hypothetical protein
MALHLCARSRAKVFNMGFTEPQFGASPLRAHIGIEAAALAFQTAATSAGRLGPFMEGEW